MNKTENDGNDYRLMKDDPEYLLSLLDKYVKVQLIGRTSFDGFMHSIDPITKSVILLVSNGGILQTFLLPGHAILEISDTLAPDNVHPPPKKETSALSEEAVSLRKNNLMSWLSKNLLPVKEEGKNIVVGSLHILPPYGLNNIYAENHVVALQIKSIIEKMPENMEN